MIESTAVCARKRSSVTGSTRRNGRSPIVSCPQLPSGKSANVVTPICESWIRRWIAGAIWLRMFSLI
jgi:hypothetical protein